MIKAQSITICGEKIDHTNHICVFFDSSEDQYEKLIPFFNEGLAKNEEIITIVESEKQSEHCSRLKTACMPYEAALARGQLRVLTSEETYSQGGIFAADRMMTMLEDMLAQAREGPYKLVRACGNMDWALNNLPGTDELMEYEARVNSLLPKYECTLVCSMTSNGSVLRLLPISLQLTRM